MTQAYLHVACVELAELLELTAMLMKKTPCRLCCTDNILRPKKLLKWPVSQFHLAHYSSTNVCLKNWTNFLNPFSSCGTTKNRINFFPQSFVEKVDKN